MKKKEIIKDDLLEEIEVLDKLLTERIVDFHDIKGMVQARHAYVYYRSILWNIRDKTNELWKL